MSNEERCSHSLLIAHCCSERSERMHTYGVVEGWPTLPAGYELGVVSDMAVDAADRVYVIDREPHNHILVFDRDGTFLAMWGDDFLVTPHGLMIGPDDRVYVTDRGSHTVWVCT